MNKENWEDIYNWLLVRGYVNSTYTEVEIDDAGLYCYSPEENLFYSIYTASGDLVFFIGCKEPFKMSFGGKQFIPIDDPEDVLVFLTDELEGYLDKVNRRLLGDNWFPID